MHDDQHPRRRAQDRERWTDDRLDDFVEGTRHQLDALGTGVGQVVAHSLQFQQLDDTLENLRDMLSETRDLCRTTNGRVTELERVRIRHEAIQAERERVLEEGRKTLALRIAETGWVRPTVIAAIVGLIAAFGPRLL